MPNFEVQFNCCSLRFQTSLRLPHLKVRGGPSFETVCGVNNRMFCESASEMSIVNAPVSIRPSMVSSPKSIAKHSSQLLFFNWKFVVGGRSLVFLPGIDRSCGMSSVHMTRIWHFVNLARVLILVSPKC